MRGRLTGSATRWVASPFDGTATRSVCDADQLRVPTKRAIKMRRSLCAVVIREYQESDRGWAEAFLNGRPVGVVTYRRESDECELAFIAALERHEGVGTALLEALLEAVAECERVWLVTTNDNLEALRFYQRRGFVLSALRPGAVADSRQRLKPQIASAGDFGIPLRDELELRLLRNRPAEP